MRRENAASDIAWRRISARARNRAGVFERHEAIYSELARRITGMTGRYVYQAYDGQLSNLTTVETETHAPKEKSKSRKVEQEKNFPFK